MSKIQHLRDYFIPGHYQLKLEIDRAGRSFGGEVVMMGEPWADEVRMHSKGLEIMQVVGEDGEDLQWRLDGDELVIQGRHYQVAVQFEGKLSDTAMHGLYVCKYQQDGQTKELFSTQFESHYARECFPCIDEPEAKATFDVAIKSFDDDPVVLSNMPGRREDDWWLFDTTPQMSTYLLAFVGGDLIKKTARTDRGTKINVYATPNQSASLLDYPLDIAKRSVEFYENYFDIDYPLPKLDNVAVPDFSAGAMENWGLITYRETALLANNNSAEDSRETVATVVAHEIAHQWFGNLVTMKWWNDLWLNESFASLMENTAVDHLHPEYNVWDDFETGDVSAALGRDALPGVQAVQQEVSTPDEIATLFDGAIVYAKGQRLLKMLRQLIGEDAFRHGLTKYFTRHRYENTVADDLWQALAKYTDYDVAGLMEPWLSRPGYPIVKASLSGNQLTLGQQQFVIGGEPEAGKTWPIPLFSNIDQLPTIMSEQALTVEVDPSQLVHLNMNDAGHYIVQYDEVLMGRLVEQFATLSVADKIKLMRESLLLSSAGYQDISQTVQLLERANDEHNQAVLATLSGLIGNLSLLVEPNSDLEKRLKQLAGRVFARSYERLFIDKAGLELSINDAKAVSTVLGRAVYADNPQALAYCRELYAQSADDIANIPSDIRATVLGAVVKHGDDAVFDQLWQDYHSTNDAELRMDIAAGLTATTDVELADKLLKAILDEQIRPQDVIYFFAWLLANRHTTTNTWRWLRDNWSWVTSTFGGDMSYSDFIQIAGKRLNTTKQLTEYDEFCRRLDDPALDRAIKVGHTDIASRIDWINRNRPVLERLLR